MAVQVFQPFEIFYDINGRPLDDGFIFIGQPNLDPIANPISVFFDEALTIPAAQPIRTRNGFPANAGVQAQVFVAETTFSISIKNKNSTVIRSVSAVHSSSDLEGRLRDSVNPLNGATIVGWTRDPNEDQTDTVHQALDSQAISLWEFSDLVVTRPTPADPSTWNWGPALIAAAALGKVIDGNGGLYGIANTVIPSNGFRLQNLTFLANTSVTGGTLIQFTGDDVSIDFTVNANGKGVTAVDANGDRITGSVTVSNITGVIQATGGTQSALKITGSDCRLSVFGRDIIRGASDNDSIPRLVTTDTSTAGTNNIVDLAIGVNVNAGWVTSQPTSRVEQLLLDTVTDNGIYCLGGNAFCGRMEIHNCSDEPFVVVDSTLTFGEVLVVNANGSASLDDGNLSIDSYTILTSDNTKQFVPLRTRTGNITSTVRIGRLSGTIALTTPGNGAGIFQFAAGAVSILEIDSFDLTVNWQTGATMKLVTHNSGTAVRIGRLALTLIDLSGTLTVADKFDFDIPVGLTTASKIDSYLGNSASGDIRIVNAFQSFMQMGAGMEASATFGPYLLMENLTTPVGRIVVSTGVPTVGTWLRGDTIFVKTPAIGSVSTYRCTTAGSPGTWRAVEWSVGRGITRPTLTANDVGVMFMDNNLDPDGKPIWWNGTAWVDATGAVV